MRLRKLLRQLKLGLAGLVGGLAAACGNPSEMPPLAPRPDQVQPVPSPSKAPVPGAPDPLAPTRTGPTNPPPQPDAAAPVTSGATFQPASLTVPMQAPPPDAGVRDAVEMPPVPDALPPDANKRPESTGFACC